jgi:hypothetical protein
MGNLIIEIVYLIGAIVTFIIVSSRTRRMTHYSVGIRAIGVIGMSIGWPFFWLFILAIGASANPDELTK